MRIFASLHDDIAEGFVWLKTPGIAPRCVVKIASQENKSIYCEALQLDQNFLSRYNRSQRHNIEEPASALVMNGWYRARLGGLKTGQDYPLEIVAANSWWGKLRACSDHPQLVVRVAMCLGILSVVLGALGLVLGIVSLVT